VSGTLLACDLDRTLIYSANALLLDGADTDAPSLVVCEVYRGAPLSFMTRSAESLLADLAATTWFVPVTTRTVAQFERVRLGVSPRYAITTNGGVLLNDGAIDEEWRSRVSRAVAEQSSPLEQIEALLVDAAATPFVLRVHRAEELFVYAIVDREIIPEHWLHDFSAACRELGWTVSLQGRKLYSVPVAVTKAAAVSELRRRLGVDTVIAAGDSELDRGMLAEADIAFRPAHGELDDDGFAAPNLTVTDARGVRAGEEILERMTAASR
jgi:hydroxymethylpyrimidine pyrophosphatase-like HAD family hydrolase